ncbi:MAG: hypothetical protein ACE366_08765 [Bradymonadia bacterium]
MSTPTPPEGPLEPDPIDDLLKLCPPSEPLNSESLSSEPLDSELDLVTIAALRGGRLDDETSDTVAGQLAVDAEARRLALAYAPTTEASLEQWALEQMPAPKRQWATWVSLGALAAGVLLVVWTTIGSRKDLPALPSYGMDTPQGAVSMIRSEDQPKAKWGVYLPESKIKLIVRPKKDISGQAPTFAVLMAEEGGALSKAPAGYTLDTGASGAFRLTAEIGPWLGERYGRFVLYVVISTDPDAASALVGEPDTALTDGASVDARTTQWYPVFVDYRRSADEIERP